MSNDPDYVPSRSSYMKRVATKCRICGKVMMDPEDCKNEMHKHCMKNYKKKTYGVR
jgi:ribosomal protein S27E